MENRELLERHLQEIQVWEKDQKIYGFGRN